MQGQWAQGSKGGPLLTLLIIYSTASQVCCTIFARQLSNHSMNLKRRYSTKFNFEKSIIFLTRGLQNSGILEPPETSIQFGLCEFASN